MNKEQEKMTKVAEDILDEEAEKLWQKEMKPKLYNEAGVIDIHQLKKTLYAYHVFVSTLLERMDELTKENDEE